MEISNFLFYIQIQNRNDSFLNSHLYQIFQLNGIKKSNIYELAYGDSFEKEATNKNFNIVLWPSTIIPINTSEIINKICELQFSIFNIEIRTNNNPIKIFPLLARNTKNNFYQINAVNFLDYYDLNEKQDFLNFNHSYFRTRKFNSISRDNKWLKKKSKNKKLYSEYKFLNHPDVIRSDLYVKTRNYFFKDSVHSYEMEYIEVVDASVLLLNNLLKDSILEKFTFNVLNYFTNIKARKPTRLQILNYKKQFNSRINQILRNPDIKVHIKFISLYLNTDILYEIKSFVKKFNLLIENNELGEYGLIHGDFCLSNIIFDYANNSFKLIDPKGIFDKDHYLPVAYDLAKLSHSLVGNYDYIVNSQSSIVLHDEINLSINAKKDYGDVIKNIAEEAKISFEVVKNIEASLFLSMLPLHLESNKKIFHLLCNFINLKRMIKD
jgi:hypothetical protein